jgi:hypothetical protein
VPRYLVCTVHNCSLVFFVLSVNGLSDVSGSKETVLQFTVPHSVLDDKLYSSSVPAVRKLRRFQ